MSLVENDDVDKLIGDCCRVGQSMPPRWTKLSRMLTRTSLWSSNRSDTCGCLCMHSGPLRMIFAQWANHRQRMTPLMQKQQQPPRQWNEWRELVQDETQSDIGAKEPIQRDEQGVVYIHYAGSG